MMEWSQLGHIGLAFLLVIALMLGLAWLFKRFGLEKRWTMFKSTSGLLSVADSLFLDPRRRVMVIALKHKRYVVMVDGDKAQLLDTLEEKELL